jgi:hypothetical protein
MASLHRALRPGGELVVVDFKRIPNQSSEWVMNHVRAGQEAFTAEIEAAGFKKTEQIDLLKDNYILRFRKVKKHAASVSKILNFKFEISDFTRSVRSEAEILASGG